jgi:2-hydroxy-3-keto-5-methylthiopentenyl-1-phosphate phosphatase
MRVMTTHLARIRDDSADDRGGSYALVLDFDGTITEEDVLQQMSRRFGDPAVVHEVEDALREGRITLREEITREFRPVTAPLDEVVDWVVAQSRVRAGLAELVRLARGRGWRVVVLSSGFEETIRPVLARVGLGELEILANSVDARPDGWRVRWRDEAVCGVCGEACKRASLPGGHRVVYVGDGISDRCAALASERVFATRGLARYLDEIGAPYEPFEDFHDVVRALEQ